MGSCESCLRDNFSRSNSDKYKALNENVIFEIKEVDSIDEYSHIPTMRYSNSISKVYSGLNTTKSIDLHISKIIDKNFITL